MLRWRRAMTVVTGCAAAFLMVSGSVVAAGPVEAAVALDFIASITASDPVNRPLPNSGCYPSGVGSSYDVITITTTSADTGSFKASISPENGDVVAALYDGGFTADNTVAHCYGRTVSAAADQTAHIYWSAKASADPTNAHTWSLVLFGDATTEELKADVSLTSNGTISVEGQPLTIISDVPSEATQGREFETRMAAVNGTAPYHFAAQGLPAGLSIDQLTGVISGAPSEAGSFAATITVTDSAATPNVTDTPLIITVAALQTPSPSATPVDTESITPTETTTDTPTETPTATGSATPTATGSASDPEPNDPTAAPETAAPETAAPPTVTATAPVPVTAAPPTTAPAASPPQATAPQATVPTGSVPATDAPAPVSSGVVTAPSEITPTINPGQTASAAPSPSTAPSTSAAAQTPASTPARPLASNSAGASVVAGQPAPSGSAASSTAAVPQALTPSDTQPVTQDGDQLSLTGAAVAGPAVVGILIVLGGGLVLATAKRRRSRHS